MIGMTISHHIRSGKGQDWNNWIWKDRFRRIPKRQLLSDLYRRLADNSWSRRFSGPAEHLNGAALDSRLFTCYRTHFGLILTKAL